jgi:hypothetical protein
VLRTLVIAAVAVAMSGCAQDGGAHAGVGTVQPDYALPSESLRDWVSFGDQVSVVSVLRETPPRLPRDWKNSGGLIGRAVTVHVDRTLWRRPHAPRLHGAVRMRVLGWMMDSDQDADSPKRPLAAVNSPRLEVGRRYLMVLVRLRGEWSALNDEAVVTLAGDTVTADVVDGAPSAPAAALKGKTIAEAAEIVAGVTPYPEAAAHPRLPPVKRMQLVYAG